MLQGAVAATLGEKLVRGLLFPLAYALLLVPFGEELVPLLQTLTARISILLLHLAGLEAHLEGVFITTRAGFFEVAEECAGVGRSEEHTSDLQSLMRISYAVFCLPNNNKYK